MSAEFNKNIDTSSDEITTIVVIDDGGSKGATTSQPIQKHGIIIDNDFKPLSAYEAEKRLFNYGKNVIAAYQPLRWYTVLYNSTAHPFNLILIGLAIFSGATSDFPTMTILLIMVIISVGIRFIQEYKSEVAAQALKNMVSNQASVIRLYSPPDTRDPTFDDLEKMDRGETEELEIPLEDIVPGDWVKLSAGDLVPGDVQIISSKDLFISQAALTGESIPVEKFTIDQKQPPVIPEANENVKMDKSELERPDLCFMGTSVVSGTATAVVLKTGSNTFFGVMAKTLASKRTANYYEVSIRRISFLFIGIMLAMMPPVLLLQGFLKGSWTDAVLFAIAVAVGLTPEMLPMIVNANLARGAIALSKHKCIVKKLDSVINLGGLDVLCTDKTGTLTRNKVELIKHLNYHGDTCQLPLYLGYLNSYFQTGLKNLMDVAVIEFYENPDSKIIAGYTNISQGFTKVDEIPFDFVRRRMSVILESNQEDHRFLISKGALDEMLSCCSHIYIGNRNDFTDGIFPTTDIVPLTQEIRDSVKDLNNALNDDGLRVIGVAFKRMKERVEFSVAHERDLILVGVCGFLDPPKASAKPAIEELMRYNVEVKVLTGDSPVVCRKVCEEINLPIKSIVTTTDIEGLDDTELEEIAEKATIFAKLTPLQKANIVNALKRRNHIVGFLGDGINDAPAIRESDCGISVDEGTDIAKESADIILLEKSLTVLAYGVMRGRLTYGNTIKYIKMAISSNFGNVFSVLAASIWLPFLPMAPIHLILQNLLYDFSQIAIPWDRMDPEFLVHPKRWSTKGIFRFMAFIGPLSSIFDLTTFTFMWFYFQCNTDEDENKVKLFQTAWFVEGLITQTLIVHVIRTRKIPFIQSTASKPVLLSTLIIMAIGIAIPFTPLNEYLGMTQLPGIYFLYLFGVLVSYPVLVSVVKVVYIKIFKDWM
ncbi:magnesium-translocating P-type ATPase [Gigaspora rosea]|uniref:Magnesium-transporting ATPase, P-type 1 n=1 Tax=Gigaspora rosea TaxID=44941 RepID=A0A397UXF5_9GLOM|nr:magnesium-translocating P-type ATPase [Gigaspora rosea]